MIHNQILSEKECEGKTIERIVTIWKHSTVIVFTDLTFCIYNVNFDSLGTEFSKEYNHAEMVKLGFMTAGEQVNVIIKQKKQEEKRQKDTDIRFLKELNAKYPNVLKN